MSTNSAPVEIDLQDEKHLDLSKDQPLRDIGTRNYLQVSRLLYLL